MGAAMQQNRARRSTSGRRRRATGSGVMSDINVTPFVDVMLVLLIIFMVTAPLMSTGIKVDLPEAKAGALNGSEEPVIVTIDKEGKLFVNKQSVLLDELIERLTAVYEINNDTRIIIRGDRQVDYGAVMQAFGQLNEAGYTKVMLETVVPR